MKVTWLMALVPALMLGCAPALVDQHGRYTVTSRYQSPPRVMGGQCVLATVEERYYPDVPVPFGASRSAEVVVATTPVQCPPRLQARLAEAEAVETGFAQAAEARANAPTEGDLTELNGLMGIQLRAIYACASGRVGPAHIRVVFGSDRSVAAVNLVAGPFRGTTEGSCMENALRAMVLPESVDAGSLPRSYLLPYTVVPSQQAADPATQRLNDRLEQLGCRALNPSDAAATLHASVDDLSRLDGSIYSPPHCQASTSVAADLVAAGVISNMSTCRFHVNMRAFVAAGEAGRLNLPEEGEEASAILGIDSALMAPMIALHCAERSLREVTVEYDDDGNGTVDRNLRLPRFPGL